MQDNMCGLAGAFLEDDALGKRTQQKRLERWPCDRDKKQLRGDPMPFRGDGGSDEHGPRPPRAWTLMWREKYSNVYGDYVPDSIRGWGYVMWDAARLEPTGVRHKLLREWREAWWTDDPNEIIEEW
jgi:hypothetical protein